MLGTLIIVIVSFIAGAWLKEKGVTANQPKFWLIMVPVAIGIVTIVGAVEFIISKH